MERRFQGTLASALCALTLTLVPPATARWMSVGPFGGNAETIVASASEPGLLLAGTKNATLSISRNAGETWEPLAFPRQYVAMLHTLAIDPGNSSVFYAAIADNSGSGLYRSRDAGKTWRPVEGIGAPEVYSLAFFAGDSKIMAAGLRIGVLLSRDGGASWKAVSAADNIEMQPVVSVAFDPADAAVVYAGTPRLPWKTTDSGATWNMVAEGMSTDSDIITVRVDPRQPARVFIGACSGFWRSLNGGGTWSKMSGIPFGSRRTYAFVQDPRHTDTIFAGTSRGLYRTRDGGAVWKEIAGHEIKSLSISGETLYIATADAGLFKSTDSGATLQPIDEGFVSRNFAQIGGIGNHLYTGSNFDAGAGTFFTSEDGGRHWLSIGDGAALANESVVAVTRGTGGTLIAATPTSLFRSEDEGKSWVRVLPAVRKAASPKTVATAKTARVRARIVPPAPDAAYHFTTLCSLNGALLAGADTAILRSTDEGRTWSEAVGTKQPVRTLLASDFAIAALPDSLLVSSDQGVTWVPRHTPFFSEVYDLAAAGKFLLAGTSRGLFRSADGGETWRAAQSGLPAAGISAVAIDPATGTRAFAYEYGHVYQSQDSGKTWHADDQDGLGGSVVRSFAITAQGQHNLLAVTATRGIFLRNLDENAGPRSDISAVDLRKDRYVPNQQNDKTPAF